MPILKMKKRINLEIVIYLVWMTFGYIGGFNAYSKGAFVECGLMGFIAVINTVLLFKTLLKIKKTHKLIE